MEIYDNHRNTIEEVTEKYTFEAWIDGENHGGNDRMETKDPAINEPITSVPQGGPKDVDAAVEAATDAFEDWRTRTPTERSEQLLEWTDMLREHVDELALLECLDAGKPIDNAEYEVEKAIDYIEYYAHIVRGDEGKQLPVADDVHAYTQNEPYGVAGLIVPWNYPLLLAAWKVGPALAAGNTAIVKPAEDTPLSVTRAAQLSREILPAGVLNVVHGYGDEVGAPLTRHEKVDKLSFTGENTTGEVVMQAAAENVTPITLELGGKSPLLVFPDADLEQAASIASDGIFYNTGQSCDAFSRTLVHEDVRDEFVELFVEKAAEWEIGDPLNEGTSLGPLASEMQFDKVREYVDVGKNSTANVAYGGDAVDVGERGDGWFHEPTIFTDVENDMRIAQEEIFGPVASVLTFGEYDEAIEMANDIDFGLVAGVATSDLSRAHRAADDIDAGTVWVNQYGRLMPGTPFGGFKDSGIGRECGKEALEAFRQTKTVNIALNDM